MDALRQKARELRNAATDAERRLWQHLRLKQLGGYKFRRQVPVAGYIADFLCPEMKLIVELDGGQHVEQSAYDAQRTRALEVEGYRVVRYWNDDALLRTFDVLEDILRALELAKGDSKIKIKSTPPQSSPALRAREEANSNSNSNSNSEGDEA
ncbi:MAG TPA: endonuclease domain-containing protein [Pseudoxanthomonas sp.]